MYGIDGIDHIARPGLLARVIAGSLPSGPSSMESPAIWRMIYENEVEAYNIPSGLIFHQLREAAAGGPASSRNWAWTPTSIHGVRAAA